MKKIYQADTDNFIEVNEGVYNHLYDYDYIWLNIRNGVAIAVCFDLDDIKEKIKESIE